MGELFGGFFNSTGKISKLESATRNGGDRLSASFGFDGGAIAEGSFEILQEPQGDLPEHEFSRLFA